MKNGHVAPLSSALLFRKGSATPADFLNGHGGGSLENTIDLAPKPPKQPDPNAAVRVSVKLDRARRQHLRLAAAKLGVSNQALLLAALDHYLRSEVPARIAEPCACLKTL
ncbi:MAG TPA: hypothetical protein VKB68_01270 [Stellaceae bacterium]|nr:hypothetical protein [Stellaceae bacterium]